MTRIRSVLPAIVALVLFAAPGFARAEETTRVRDVVYGHKFGMALTLDVLKPTKPNGAGVIFMVSGGFNSDMAAVDAGFFGPVVLKPLLDRGYTLFLVCHGSQPKFTVGEIVADIHRSVRFIRVHAKDYGVDPDRLGIMGISSGGYLSLMIGTNGKPGDPKAKDVVDRASSRVQAVACFCPPADLVDYGKTGRTVLEYEPVKFVWHAFGLEGKPREEQIKVLRELSPFAAISKQTPPTLIIHGDADPLVPYEQSERFDAKLAENGVPHRLVTRKGAGHVWPEIAKDVTLLADWFDKQLSKTAPTPAAGEPPKLLATQPLVPGAKVVTLWPAGSPMLKALDGWDKPEVFNRNKTRPERVDSVTNIHNPSIEVHLAPPDKANGMAVIIAPGGGNTTCVAGTEGVDIANWLNGLGIHAFIERYRLKPYGSQTDALADTQRAFRVIRANSKEWDVDPKRVGIMGFSAGGEQAALAALHFDAGKADADDPIERFSCRPDFTVLVYAGWRTLDLSQVPKGAPPAFLVSAGLGDASHAKRTVEFYDAYFQAKVPVDLHIYDRGGHGGGIGPRNGIPFGRWPQRFIDWAKDQGFMTPGDRG